MTFEEAFVHAKEQANLRLVAELGTDKISEIEKEDREHWKFIYAKKVAEICYQEGCKYGYSAPMML